jgi:phage/plasmid-like protein (TIGR03299 family)
MSHEIRELDNATYSLTPAWHGLGTVLSETATIADVRQAIAGYDVEQTPGWIPYSEETGRIWKPTSESEYPPNGVRWLRTEAAFNTRTDLRLPDRRALLSPVGVGEGYEIVQNGELCDIAETVIGESGSGFESCGTLRNGRLVWILARWPDGATVQGDRIGRYLLIYSSHDGSKQIVVAATSVRVVCWNTLSAALDREKDNQICMRHTANVRDRIAEALRLVQLSKARFDDETTLFQSMSEKAITERFVQGFLLALYPNPEGDNRKTGHAVKKRERITDLLRTQPGADSRALRSADGQPTAYGLYNAITQYWQHESTSRVRNGNDKTEERFRSNMFGSQADSRGLALRNLQPERIEALVGSVQGEQKNFSLGLTNN